MHATLIYVPRFRAIAPNVFGNIWIVIQLVLNVEAGRRALENEIGHQRNVTARRQTLIWRKVGRGGKEPIAAAIR